MFWPDGIVYYTLADDVMRSGAYIDIYDAMKHIEERCNISFHKKQSNTKNWIEFVLSEDDVSRSHLGMTGGKQNIWVTSDVNTSTAIIIRHSKTTTIFRDISRFSLEKTTKIGGEKGRLN